jgi:hypothetical protein
MSYFFILIDILFFATIVFYLVFFALVHYWHEKKTTSVIVPLIYTFEFFAVGFLLITIVSILIEYLPKILSFK